MYDSKETLRGTNDLIVFDVEGVVIPKRRYLPFEATRKVGVLGSVKIIMLGLLYEIGLRSLESTLKSIFMMLRGLTVDDILQSFKGIPLMPAVEAVFERLKHAGYKIALISSGLPFVLVENLATRLNADYAFGLELEIENAYFTGVIGGDVIKPDGKAIVLKKILEKEGLSYKDCVLVADDRNNLSMFPLCNLRVGYNPDFILSAKSDFVVKDDLSEVLPIVTQTSLQVPRRTISQRRYIREAIHVGSFFLPFVCIFLFGNTLTSLLILILTLLYGVSEVARLRGFAFPVISEIKSRAAYNTELHEVATAPIFFALGITLSLIIFPATIGYAAIAILTLGDGFAKVFGRRIGRNRFSFNKGKNVEGSIFGFLFAFFGAMLFIDPMKAFFGAAVGMLMECMPLPIDDNLIVPLTAGLALTLIP